MLYAALEMIGNTELVALEVMIDDLRRKNNHTKIRIEGEDSTKVVRQLYYYLQENGFYHNRQTGQVEGLIFGVVDNWELLISSRSFYKYIRMEGGLLNPCLLFFDGKKLPTIRELTGTKGVEGIVELVRRFHQLRCKSIA
jgi:hypothetical protein